MDAMKVHSSHDKGSTHAIGQHFRAAEGFTASADPDKPAPFAPKSGLLGKSRRSDDKPDPSYGYNSQTDEQIVDHKNRVRRMLGLSPIKKPSPPKPPPAPEKDSSKPKKPDLKVVKPEDDNLNKKQGVPKGVDPAKHERCVREVKKQGGKYNPYAVCNASLKKMTAMTRCRLAKNLTWKEWMD